MENTPPSENNIPIPDVIVVEELPEPSNQEDTENRNEETGSPNEENFQVQDDSRSSTVQKMECWNGMYAFVILGIGVAWSCTITMIPQHNIFEHPEFWWEGMILGHVFVSLDMALHSAWQVYVVFNGECFNSKLCPLIYFTAFYLGFNIPYVCIYIFWTVQLGYNFPIPFCPVVPGFISNISLMAAIWFGFPCELRSQPEFRHRLTSFLLYLAICFTIIYQQVCLDTIFAQLKDYEKVLFDG